MTKHVKIKLLKDTEKFKKGEEAYSSYEDAIKDEEEGIAKIIPEEPKQNTIKKFIEECSKENIEDWIDERKYNIDILKTLKIGKCTIEVMNLLMKECGREELIKAGLLKSSRFTFINRIIIPYSDNYFAARSLNKNSEYKNLFPAKTKKQPFFIKGKEDICFIVEGETDAIALKHMLPTANAFSIGGSNSYNLLKGLKEYYAGKNVILAFDNDTAGKKATDKSAQLLCDLDYTIKRLVFDSKIKDVDEYFSKGLDKKDFSFKEIELKKQTKQTDRETKKKELEEIKKGVAKGDRNNACFKIAMSYRVKGTSKEEILPILEEWNENNEPPLIEKELDNIIESVYNYKMNNGYGFILNSEEVWESKLFSFDKLNGDVAYFGLLLPKEKDFYGKKGEFLYRTQIRSPALITSNREIIPVNMRLRETHKINIKDTPGELRLRWKLESINDWVNGNIKSKPLKEIFEKIKQQYEKYIYMSDIWADIHTLWDINTYFFPLYKVFPLFELRGLAGTGKTKTMGISSFITLNATDILVNPSEATLFRETNDKRPTKYIDEAENLFRINQGKPEPDPRVEVINSSYRYDGCVPRQEKINGKFVTVYYHTYSPTMISSINGLYGATENRSIIRISTKPRKSDEQKGSLEPEADNKIWQEIRNELYIYAIDNWKLIDNKYKTFQKTTELKNRDYWLWKPLLILAQEISDELYEKVLAQAIKQQETKQADYINSDSIEYKILEIMYNILLTSETVYVHDIHEQLVQNQYTPKERTISSKLDKIGFRDFRCKDRNGSFFKIPENMFESIILPICPSLFLGEGNKTPKKSPQSSQSSQKEEVIDDNKNNNSVMNGDDCDEKKKEDVTNVTNVTVVTKKATVKDKKDINIFYEYIKKNPKCSISDIIFGLNSVQEEVTAELNKLKKNRDVFETSPDKWVVLE